MACHFSFGRKIAQNLSDFNLYDALKGSEHIYYFMPGLRYFSSLNNYILEIVVMDMLLYVYLYQ